MGRWTFLRNHGLILVFLSNQPEITGRDLALSVGITERAVRRIINDLEVEGYVTKKRNGRKMIYTVNPKLHFRHPTQRDQEIGILLRALGWNRRLKHSKT